jgi:chemotaxis protein MotA
MFEYLGKYSPAFGMIGTLIGMIIMLQHMDNSGQIGAGMALALTTTLYGAVAANLVFLPIADKLAAKSREEILVKQIIIRGILSIQSGDNPRIVEQKLRTFLPASMRTEKETSAHKAA